ncbi:hypothetical protein C0993_007655 [Termitomyces sp. T159_Od127]|nr:hypothetical protein C0993_007655 [Termitomyces sp. T159_Od127]
MKAWFTFADAIIKIEDNHCEALRKAEEERRCLAEQDVKMIGASPTTVSKRKANVSPLLLAHCIDMLSISLRPQANPEPKPHMKKPKITPAFAPHKPGSDTVLALLAQVDAALEAVQLAENGNQVSHTKLQKHCDVVD